jgi:hypothetical protein
MSIVTKSILKGYFETGDRPTEGQFIDLIDSLAVLGTNTNDITFVGTVTATTGSFGYLDLTGGSNFNSIDVGGGYGNTGLTVTSTGQLSTDDYILTETYVSASTFLSTPKIKSPSTDFIIIQNAITVQGSITASGDISVARTGSFGHLNVTEFSNVYSTSHITASGDIKAQTGSFGVISASGDISASRVSASGGFEADTLSTSSFGLISASGNISSSDTVFGLTGSFRQVTAVGDVSSSGTGSFMDVFIDDNLEVQGVTNIHGNISSSNNVTASFGYISSSGDLNIIGQISASRVSASGGFEADTLSTSSFGLISASGNISSSDTVFGLTGSFGKLLGDGSSLTGIQSLDVHGNQVSITGSQTVPEGVNNTLATNNTGEFTIPVGAEYTVNNGAQVDLQYTPIAERLYRYDVDTGTFKAYAQANIDSETTLIKGFGAATAGVGNDSTVRHNATVPENFVTILYTTTNVTQSEDPNNNPITTDPHSITIQDQSTYTIKSGADVTVDGVHHGVVRKDIALFKTVGIGDTQAIGPSGSNSFNDQYNNIYPSASAHLHISASNPVVKIEAASGIGLLSIDGNISASSALTASNLLIDGDTIDFTGLPTSDPGVVGRLWNNSGDLKISS